MDNLKVTKEPVVKPVEDTYVYTGEKNYEPPAVDDFAEVK